MIPLRPYQRKAVDAIFRFWEHEGGNPLVDLATGTGKSLVIATLAREVCELFPEVRILMLVHVRELVQQNALEMLRSWPQAPVGINSAGLGRRDKHSRILFASIQSVARESAETLGPRHLVLIDEAHLLPKSGDGQYHTLLRKLRETVPDLRIAGFTATPYRLDSGRLDDGDGSIFDETVFSYDIGQGVEDKFLSPLVSRATGQIIDVSNVARRGGEFVPGALERAANVASVTEAACDEIVARGADRKSWLIFCAGVDHAYVVRDALRRRGIAVEAVTGETNKGERDASIRAFKDGRLRALTNANVLTVGFNAPNVDLIAMLRPTLSTSLYVQMLGRGTRLHPNKTDCLVLDFAQNVRRHGPVDAVTVSSGGKSEVGKVSVDAVQAKACPVCETLVSLRTYTCIHCGHEWPTPAPKHEAFADRDAAVMTREIIDRWLPVTNLSVYPHHKEGAPTSMRVEYAVGATIYREWVTLEHVGFAGAKAARWWRAIVGTPAPNTTREAIARATEIAVMAVVVARDGKFWRVTGWRARRADGRIIEVNEKFESRPVALQIVRGAA